MDIDDILREVDPASQSIPAETRDLQALTRAWVSERSSPELLQYVHILPYPPIAPTTPVLTRRFPSVYSWPADGLFERINDRIKQQIERVEEMTGDMDPKTNFALIVIQTELERFKYLVRSYLRARIAKVFEKSIAATADLRARLSETEQAYATRHQALLHNHYLSSFLSAFPPTLQNLNDTAGNISMIETPDLDTAVFIRLLKETLVEGHGTDMDDDMDGKSGDIVILRWSDAKSLVDSGHAEVV
ncbi:hypothetical protein E0Z10_g4631 [Xylaria hypoxylon]|uniref:DNA replication complex GINS protein SLD5 n=1 Tax=Xylaria hypoxylon TaxID=37992 RepID=A0A4Z0YY70_9PEZI|nr:hypothetical protein E0Z10_g4631 [Xylaria hypoxylon]